jgi:hypothetical protein
MAGDAGGRRFLPRLGYSRSGTQCTPGGGFPLGLFFGWFYEISTKGIVRTPSADGETVDASPSMMSGVKADVDRQLASNIGRDFGAFAIPTLTRSAEADTRFLSPAGRYPGR